MGERDVRQKQCVSALTPELAEELGRMQSR